MSEQTLHQSVMLNEVVEALNPVDQGFYLDATFGNGGYSRAILEAANCTVLAIDRDPEAIERGAKILPKYRQRLHLMEGCFSNMKALLNEHLNDFTELNGAVFDLGVCSTQLDQPERGFSFRSEGPLDMRMSKSGQSAADVVMRAEESELATILWKYGEERAARRIARAICHARNDTNIVSTTQLAKIIQGVMPTKKPGQIDPATRSFQALRIFVNRELDELIEGLEAVEQLLRPGGVLAIVSFHSLEDRIVKQFLTARSQHATQPSRHVPAQKKPLPTFELPHRKPILPSAEAKGNNVRARSAKLRIASRTSVSTRPQSNGQNLNGLKDGQKFSSLEAKICV